MPSPGSGGRTPEGRPRQQVGQVRTPQPVIRASESEAVPMLTTRASNGPETWSNRRNLVTSHPFAPTNTKAPKVGRTPPAEEEEAAAASGPASRVLLISGLPGGGGKHLHQRPRANPKRLCQPENVVQRDIAATTATSPYAPALRAAHQTSAKAQRSRPASYQPNHRSYFTDAPLVARLRSRTHVPVRVSRSSPGVSCNSGNPSSSARVRRP